MAKIKIINSPADKYVDEYYNYCLKRSFINPLMIIIYILLFIFISLGIQDGVIGNFIFALLWIFIFYLITYFSIRKKRIKTKSLLKNSTQFYEISDENIIIENEKKECLTINYNLVSKLIETKNLFVIQFKNSYVFLISKNNMKRKDIEKFIEIMNIAIPKKKNKLNKKATEDSQ